jgi:hypothetical protein
MDFRTRSRTLLTSAGSVTYPGMGGATVGGATTFTLEKKTTKDYWHKQTRRFDPTGFGLPPSDFESVLVEKTWTPLNGAANEQAFGFHNIPQYWVASYDGGHPSPPFGKDKGNDAYALKLLARTNPMRPVYSIPVAIREMVELALLFELRAKSFGGFLGGAYLNYRFGWLSFLDDIRTLATIVEKVNSRIKELNSLVEHGGLRRNIPLDNFGYTESGNHYISSTWGYLLEGHYEWSTDWKIWGSVRWYPVDYNLIPTAPADTWLLAVRQAFDLGSLDSKTLWDLLPWSWLVDYFTNIGDSLAANEGRALIRPSDVCIMRQTRTVLRSIRRPTGTLGDNVKGGNCHVTTTTKKRTVITSPPGDLKTSWNLLSVSESKVVLALLAKWAT